MIPRIFCANFTGEIPCKKIHETKHALAFHDIAPGKPTVHALVIPKALCLAGGDFTAKASVEEIAELMRAIGEVANILGATESGYRCLSNCGQRRPSGGSPSSFPYFGGES